MKKLRLVFGMLFLVEITVALMHLAVFAFSKKEYPLELYWIIPIFILVISIFAFMIKPVIDRIIGEQ